MNDDLRMLYQSHVEDIRSWKNRQWLVTTSAISLLVVLHGVFQDFDANGCTTAERWIVLGTTWLLTTAAVWVLWDLHMAMREARQRLIEIPVPEEINRYFVHARGYARRRYGASMSVLLTLFVVVGSGLLTWMVCTSP